MSHSSGITVSEALVEAFSNASRNTSTGVRIIKAQIVDETSIDLIQTVDPVKEWEKDFDLVPPLLNDKEASYVLYRTDQTSQGVALWYILCYVPERCKVRDKMVYASSRANVKASVGANYIVDEIFGTIPSEFNCAGFQAWKKHQEAEVPLTEIEIQKNEELEQGLFKGGAGTSTAYVHGVSFPVDDSVLGALDAFVAGTYNYVQVEIDATNERIMLGKADNLSLDVVHECFPKNEPRFHFYRWTHIYEDEQFHSIVYCYSCPSSPVKLRMLYSSSKSNVSSIAESKGITLDCKLELSDPKEFNEKELTTTLHPPKEEQKKAFAKPKPKGGRQLIRNKD